MLTFFLFYKIIQVLLKFFAIWGTFNMFGHDARSFRFCFVDYSFILAEILMFVNTL